MEIQEKFKKSKQSKSTIILSLYTLILGSIFVLFNSLISTKTIKATASRYPLFNASIEMNVLVINAFNISRVLTAYQVWGKDFLKMFPNSSFQIVSRRNLSSVTKYSLQVDFIPTVAEYQNHIFGFVETLLHFCTEPTKRWYIRTTEDAFIDISRLQSYIDDLEQKYDPLNDFVMKGQLCKPDFDYSFLHGGSGWIMSRKAACEVNKEMNSLLNSFFLGQSGDDTITHIIQESFSLSDQEMDSNAFLGTKLSNHSVEMLKSNNFSQIPKCREYFYLKYNDPSSKMLQLNQVIFWHSGRPDNFPMYEAYEILNRIPDNIHVVFPRHEAHICWQ